MDLGTTPLPDDAVGLLEGIAATRAIRRYRDEPVPAEALRGILFAATPAPRAARTASPSASSCSPTAPTARQAKALIGGAARRIWAAKRDRDGYAGSGADDDSPKARMARTMQRYVDEFERTPGAGPAVPRPLPRARPSTEGASIYPACQNLLLAARALGYGGVLPGSRRRWHELRTLLGIPDEVFMAATITIGRPEGGHGPVRRRPMAELVYEERWGEPAPFAVDPPGTRHTSAGPPRRSARRANR